MLKQAQQTPRCNLFFDQGKKAFILFGRVKLDPLVDLVTITAQQLITEQKGSGYRFVGMECG